MKPPTFGATTDEKRSRLGGTTFHANYTTRTLGLAYGFFSHVVFWRSHDVMLLSARFAEFAATSCAILRVPTLSYSGYAFACSPTLGWKKLPRVRRAQITECDGPNYGRV